MSDFNFEEYDSYITKGEAKTVAKQAAAEAFAEIANVESQAAQGRARAVEQLSQKYPDFKQFAFSQDAATVLKENPVLGEAIAYAEYNPALQDKLVGLYEMGYKLGKTSQPSTSYRPDSQNSQTERLETPRLMNEETIFASTEASKRVDLSPQNRKNLITSMEERGILDVSF